MTLCLKPMESYSGTRKKEDRQNKETGKLYTYNQLVEGEWVNGRVFVKASGLQRVCAMLLVPIPFAERGVWALPFLSTLAPSERYAAERGKKQHKKFTDRARQMLLMVRRWPP